MNWIHGKGVPLIKYNEQLNMTTLDASEFSLFRIYLVYRTQGNHARTVQAFLLAILIFLVTLKWCKDVLSKVKYTCAHKDLYSHTSTDIPINVLNLLLSRIIYSYKNVLTLFYLT